MVFGSDDQFIEWLAGHHNSWVGALILKSRGKAKCNNLISYPALHALQWNGKKSLKFPPIAKPSSQSPSPLSLLFFFFFWFWPRVRWSDSKNNSFWKNGWLDKFKIELIVLCLKRLMYSFLFSEPVINQTANYLSIKTHEQITRWKIIKNSWRWGVSIPLPNACKAFALPCELHPPLYFS